MSYITNSGIVLAIIAFIFFIFKNYIIQYITKSVAHHYDKKFENCKSIIQARQTEQKQFQDLLMHTVTHENLELRFCSASSSNWL